MVFRGAVQGVGFRPEVLRIATRLGLSGSVRNDGEGATIELEGAARELRLFREELLGSLPPLARIDALDECELAPRGDPGFRIEASRAAGRRHALVPPDAKVCAACRAEMSDPGDRRHAYPFTTCTHCGPRFTLTASLPYDRERTSMARFPLCPACAREYGDPADRRFHAEPLCCPECGPLLVLVGSDGTRLGERDRALELARALLSAGRTVALKGIGGFQLACRADDDAPVSRLRAAKGRPTKPFAIMVRDLAAARSVVRLRPEDAAILDSPRGPILLAPIQKGAAIAKGVAPGVDDLGVMLPTSPLHVELFRDAPYGALVTTSGNASDEPICRTDDEARARLAPFADAILLHDREILRRCDDSVVRTTASGHVVVRRSRGYVPEPLALPVAAREPVLALGAHLQDTVALAVGNASFPSQHVGDLDHEAAREFQLEVALGLERFLQAEARVVAVDLHPDYPSTWLGERLARERSGRILRVQHHLAHAAAVLAEHGRFPAAGEVVGAIVFDGTGYGPDGTAWGGEWLEIGGDLRWRRVARAERVPLIGSESAVREPWRVAAAVLARAGLAADLAVLPIANVASADRLRAIADIAQSDGFPLASGVGRLFEAAGALLGLCGANTYEGEAAARLEALASRSPTLAPPWTEVRLPQDVLELPTTGLLVALARRLLAHRSPSACAAGFHATLAALAAQLAVRAFGPRVETVALAGGCFVNRLLTRQLTAALELGGYAVVTPRAVPPGDGGIAYGQTVVATLALAQGVPPTQHGDP